MDNQELRLLAHFKKHGTINPLEAWTQLGIYRLSSTVHKLRQNGHCIQTERISVTNRFGEECKVARYVYDSLVFKNYILPASMETLDGLVKKLNSEANEG